MKKLFWLLLFSTSLAFGAASVKTELVYKKKNIRVGTTSVNVEVADTQPLAEHGLMFRHELKEGNGMLFIFPDEEVRSFWMKNTFIELSIGYFDQNKKLVDIQDMKPVTSEMQTDLPVYPSKAPAKYALEVPKGWFERHKIKVGEKFSGL